MRSLILVVTLGLVLGAASRVATSADEHPRAGGAGSVSAPAQCDLGPATDLGEAFFTDVSDASGVRDGNFDPDPPEDMRINDHSRLAFADIDGDGWDDIVAHDLYPNPQGGVPFTHVVLRNNGDGTFANVSEASGLRDVQAGFFLFGDVDNDGDQDAFAGLDVPIPSSTAPDPDNRHRILLNDGAGHFTELPGSGVDIPFNSGGNRVHYTGNAVFADFDGDANLDLYLGNGHTTAGVPDQLLMGGGDGTFTDATSRLARIDRASNGSTTCDYDGDGDTDIIVSVYGVSVQNGHNILWENDGSGHFTNVARPRGFEALATGNYYLAETGYGRDPQPGATAADWVGGNGFGLQCGDANNDGRSDIFITTISHPDAPDFSRRWSDPSQLLINQGPDGGHAFVNEWLDRSLPFNEGDVDGAMLDFDNDGYVDLSLSRERKYEGRYEDPEQKGWFGLMQQQADGSFESVGLRSGINDLENDPPEWLRMKGAQNHAWSDVDHDGDLDLLVGGRTGGKTGRPNFLFENRVGDDDAGERNHWLAFRLHGDGEVVNRDAIGARVELDFGALTMLREVTSSRGMYNSMDTRTLHFGLGLSRCAFTARIHWPNGRTWAIGSDVLGHDKVVELTYTPGSPPPFLPTVTPDPAWPTDTPRPPTAVPTATIGPTPTEAAPRPLHLPRLYRE